MGRTACTEPQCLYKGALYLTLQDRYRTKKKKIPDACLKQKLFWIKWTIEIFFCHSLLSSFFFASRL